ncbi:MAG TPA: hypothetical protein P5092_01950 [Ruminococcus sp.]|nr:hypothetical protein [Ruminococcus sp.]
MKRTLAVVCAVLCTATLTSCEVGGIFGAFLNDDKEDSSISVLYTSGDDTSYGSEEEEGEPVYYIDEDGDIEWAKNSAPNFDVSTAGQLAGVVYYVNNIYTYSPDTQLTINIYNDIDLSNWVWEPMGRIDKDGTDRRFNGSIIGNGHTISNMSIKYYSGDCYGLVGRAESFSAKNVIITDADINAPSGLAGMYCGKVDGTGDCEGLDCTGKITTGASVLSGAFFGAAPKINIISAGSYVELNGERAVFGSREDYILQNPDDERFFRVDLDNDTKCINVEHSPEFTAPQWVIFFEGNETFRQDFIQGEPLVLSNDILPENGYYSVYIEAEDEGFRLPCSNIYGFYNIGKTEAPLSIDEDSRKRIVCLNPDKIAESNYDNLCWIMEYEGTRVYILTYSGNEEFNLLKGMMQSDTASKAGEFTIYLADADGNDITQVSNSIVYSVNEQE